MGITLDDISPMCKTCENTNGQPNGECLNKCGAAVKKLREEYERAYNQLAQAHPYTLGSFHLNLTTNWCGDGYSPLPFVLEQQNSHTADGYFEEFSKLIADENIRGEFFARFNRTALLEAFARGERAASIEYPILYADGNRYWREGRLYMIQNPVTGDVEAVTYALDINEKKKTADIINLITQEEFDYIGVIYLNARSFEFFNKKSNIAYPAAHEIVSYDHCCEYVRANFVDAEERTQFDAAVNIDSIVAGLEKTAGTRRLTGALKTASYPAGSCSIHGLISNAARCWSCAPTLRRPMPRNRLSLKRCGRRLPAPRRRTGQRRTSCPG